MLRKVLGEVGIEVFLKDYLGKKPLLLKDIKNLDFSEILTKDDFNNLLLNVPLTYPEVSLHKLGDNVAESQYTTKYIGANGTVENRIDVTKAQRLYADGYTILLSSFNNRWPKLNLLCDSIRAHLGFTASANAFISPEDSQSFPAHFDNHDVMILQIAGSKRWIVSEPPEQMPLSSSRTPDKSVQLFDTRLSTGDFLYLPCGTVHEVLTTDESSIHVTIAVKPVRVCDVAGRALRFIAADEIDGRKFIDGGAILNGDSKEIARQVKVFLQKVVEGSELEDFVDRFLQETKGNHMTSFF